MLNFVLNLLLNLIGILSFATLLATPAWADGRQIEIVTKDGIFTPSVVEIAVGEKVELVVKNEGHEAEEFESLDLKREKVLPPGKSIVVKIGPLKAGSYTFFGDFHPQTARGESGRQMTNASGLQLSALIGSFFVVWRETFEAFLIVFLLWMGLSRAGLWRAARYHITAGVLIGVALSGVFAFALFRFSDVSEGSVASFLKAVFPLIAAGFMLHMVTWMSKHAHELSSEIKSIAHRPNFGWGAMVLVAYSFSRDGFETVVYLYGMSLNPQNAALGWLHYTLLLVTGTAATAMSLLALKRGMGFFNLKTFFRITNFFLLGTAASLLVTGVDRLIELEYLPSVVDPVWNSSWLVSGASSVGQVLRMIAGYVPTPSLTLIIAYFGFWAIAIALMLPRALTRKTAAA